MIDRYTKAVLTLIATALVYLCVVLTPLPGVQAQGTQRPGESTGPMPVVIVGWGGAPGTALPVSTTRPVEVTGRVSTDKATERADRVVLVGWEIGATRDARPASPLQSFTNTSSIPVDVKR